MKEWFIEQLAMYSAYHRNGRNQATHHIGVPVIVFSLLVLASSIPLISWGDTRITFAVLIVVTLVGYYLLNALTVGFVAAIVYGSLLYGADQVALVGTPFAVKIFAVLFIVGWTVQFIGHVFEGRRPALFDNITQIFIAPAFLISEWLFALGLEQPMKTEIKNRAIKYLSD